jgi:hypothetical protein
VLCFVEGARQRNVKLREALRRARLHERLGLVGVGKLDCVRAAKGLCQEGGVGRFAADYFGSSALEFRELALRSAQRPDLLADFEQCFSDLFPVCPVAPITVIILSSLFSFLRIWLG